MMASPVFIVGVPRSGTTLLRVMLDSHPCIVCGPESPWLCGVYGKGVSLKDLYYDLIYGEYGPVRNYAGIEEQDVAQAVRGVMDTIMEGYCSAKGKMRWVEKTPNHITQIPFIHTIYPDAQYIHTIRDGRDVACSTVNKRAEGYFGDSIVYDHENGIYIANNRLNALRRWKDWNRDFCSWEQEYGLQVQHLRYEDLVTSPRETMAEVLDFMGELWNDQVIRYYDQEHDYPDWEAGSQDLKSFDRIHDESVGCWRQEFTRLEKLQTRIRFDPYLVSWGYSPTDVFS